LVNSTTKIN
jgi:hypothetical protein